MVAGTPDLITFLGESESVCSYTICGGFRDSTFFTFLGDVTSVDAGL